MGQVKTFKANIKDEFGGVYPNAFVAVRMVSETLQKTRKSADCVAPYTQETETGGISYKVNYWYSEQTREDGYKSRPLLAEVDGSFTDLFTLDVDDVAIALILARPGDHDTNVDDAIAHEVSKVR